MSRPIAAFLTCTGLFFATEAQAQHLFRGKAARQVTVAPAYPTAPTTTSTTPGMVFSYSYYTRSNLPVRSYVGYGNNDFPFHGTPYGHPYDPYTWSAMSNSYQAEMSRYYAPPLK